MKKKSFITSGPVSLCIYSLNVFKLKYLKHFKIILNRYSGRFDLALLVREREREGEREREVELSRNVTKRTF